MKKRGLSLLLALVLVLGLVPVTARADSGLYGDTNGNGTVDVYLSMSFDGGYYVGQGKVMAMVPVSLPYFDLSLYDLEEYYFSSETYVSNGSGGAGSILPAGDENTARNKITMLHLLLYATEAYYLGGTGGSGELKDFLGTKVLTFTGGRGSSYMEQFWGGDCNLNYYRNYEYPLASPGHGATSDQILLRDGDIVSIGHFSDWGWCWDSAMGFNYITAPKTTVVAGESVRLTVKRAGKSFEDESAGTVHSVVTTEPTLYYWRVDNDFPPSANVTEWVNEEDAHGPLGTVDDQGNFMLDTTNWDPGTYLIAMPGEYGEENPDSICSTPGGMLLTVDGDEEPEAPQPPAVTVDTSKLGGLLPAENIQISGETMTIAPADNTPACMVLVKNGDQYTRVAATKNADNTYNFNVSNLPEGASIVVAAKADLDGNGTIDAPETVQIKAAQLGNLTTFSNLQNMVADLDGNGEIDATETVQIKAAQLGNFVLGW